MTKIGIFDSGIGGLSILKEVHLLDRALDIYYVADSINNPYGDKQREFIVERSVEITSELISEGCELIVLACNTATAWAIDELRAKFPQTKFVGVEPYINVINKRDDLKDKKGLILATPRTGESKRFKELKERLDPDNTLDIFLPARLAQTVETHFFNQDLLKKSVDVEVENYPSNYDFYILGCTHYPLIAQYLKDNLNGEMISPCPMVADRINSLIQHEAGEKRDFFFFKQTGRSTTWERLKYSEIF
jgi:glutamate racemase